MKQFSFGVTLTLLFFFFFLTTHNSVYAQMTSNPIYLNPSYSFEERAADLVSKLTLEEKQSLLGNNMAAIPRLGIKSMNVWSEALHGVLGSANTTVGLAGPTSFPNSVALGSAWDPSLMQREAAAIADEARAFNATGTKGLTYWSPVVEPIRDPRWGRTGEAYGEDPFLVSQIAAGFVRGMMGNDPTYIKTVPCAKHYFANNSEFDRHVSSSNMDGRDMREFYLSPYRKLIQQDKIPSIMSSYNAVNGVPTSASMYYLDTIARRTYGLKGYITGDCQAINDIYSGHKFVKTAEEATGLGLKAGVDSDCGSVYQKNTISALKKGLLTMADIDRALLNSFTIRMRTGEYDAPARVPWALYQTNMVNSPANKALAHEVATKTPVLLKNNIVAKTGSKALPINLSGLKKIALLGPQADEVELGPYSGKPATESLITPAAGIRNYISDKGLKTEVLLAVSGNSASKSNLLYVAQVELKKTDGTVTNFDATKFSASSKGITVGSGLGSLAQVRTINDGSWTSYNDVDLTNIDTIGIQVNIPSDGGILEIRVGSPQGNLLGTLNAYVAAGARRGGYYGSGRIMKVKANRLGYNGPQTLYFVYKAPEDPKISDETLAVAKSADVAVLFVGTDEKTATEEADRLSLALPGNQLELIKAVAAVNPNTIVVMQTLGCVEVEAFKDLQNIPGILWVGYNGQAQGSAIASILFGEVNPGGKLNATWYKSVNDLPEITDYTLRGGNGKNGRTFWYFNKDVTYEFGYGLSYTNFEYSNFKINRSSITPNSTFTISVDVKNTGSREGDEVVQVYMRTPESPEALQRPIKRLKGFRRVTIPAGQTKTVTIEIDAADLWFWDMAANKTTYDQGRYIFEIGASSKDIKGLVSTNMSGTFKAELNVVVASCGTVVLQKGLTAQTSVTASMTDDSFYDLSQAKVVYSSNNRQVADVDAKGLVTAKSVGSVTISAHVTIGAKTITGSYPLKIMPNLDLTVLEVNKKAIAGFIPSELQYSYLLKMGAKKAPRISAKAYDPAVVMTINQAKGLPGTASISLIDTLTSERKDYVVNFGLPFVSDEFNTPVIGKSWKWLRENASNWSLSKQVGALVINSVQGDVSASSNNAENILLQSANTDWVLETKMTCSRKPSGYAQNAGILAFQDDDHFVKLVYTAGIGRRGFGKASASGEQLGSVELQVESKGTQKSSVALSMDGIIASDNVLILRLEKKGDLYTASCSADGKVFKPVGFANIVLKDVQAGILVCNGITPTSKAATQPVTAAASLEKPFEVAFDYFRLTNSGL